MARLIDADALRERYDVVDPAGTFSYCDSIMATIDKQPTIDAIPVEWLEHMKTAITLTRFANSIKDVLALWQRFGSKEQEAR